MVSNAVTNVCASRSTCAPRILVSVPVTMENPAFSTFVNGRVALAGVVSKRIREEFENGKDYYRLQGMALREPSEQWARPSAENLEYHAYNVFR